MVEWQQIPQVVPEYSAVAPLIEPHAHLPEIWVRLLYVPISTKIMHKKDR